MDVISYPCPQFTFYIKIYVELFSNMVLFSIFLSRFVLSDFPHKDNGFNGFLRYYHKDLNINTNNLDVNTQYFDIEEFNNTTKISPT